MIYAHIRKNFIYPFPIISSFLGKSNVSCSLLLHSFSTSRETKGQTVANPAVSELLLRKPPQKSEPILLFLKESGFSDAHLEKMVKSRQQLLSANLEKTIKPKIKIFQELGFSASEMVEIISREPTILCCSTSNRVIPSLTALKGLLGSNDKVAKVLRRCGWFLKEDLDKRMLPNVEFLKSCGVPAEHVLYLLTTYPRCLFLMPEIVRERVAKVDRFSVDPSSKMYTHCFGVVCSMSNEVWELKLQALIDLGFSETDIQTIFKKAPKVFFVSVEKWQGRIEVRLACGKYTTSSIVRYPVSLCSSIEKRLKPRLHFLEILEKRNLIKKWPALGLVQASSDEGFYEKFVAPYIDEVGQVYTGKSVFPAVKEKIKLVTGSKQV